MSITLLDVWCKSLSCHSVIYLMSVIIYPNFNQFIFALFSPVKIKHIELTSLLGIVFLLPVKCKLLET